MTKRIVLLISVLFAVSTCALAQKAKDSTTPLKIGDIAPNFKLQNDKHVETTLSNTGKLTMLVFFRGYW